MSYHCYITPLICQRRTQFSPSETVCKSHNPASPGPARSLCTTLKCTGGWWICTLLCSKSKHFFQHALLQKALCEHCLAICPCLPNIQLSRPKIQQQDYTDPTLLTLTYLPDTLHAAMTLKIASRVSLHVLLVLPYLKHEVFDHFVRIFLATA